MITQTVTQRGNGPRFPQTGESDWNITVEPGPTISWVFQMTSHTPRGTVVGQKFSHSAPLNQPFNTPDGEASWQYTEGTLIFVRSYENGGATRTSIVFNQNGQKLTCSASLLLAHEKGKNTMTMKSIIDGTPITIFSWKPVSSSCDITR